MNKFIARAQQLGKKAAELQQAVQALPAHAAKIREAVTMTGGELKQLRADVQSSIHSLRTDSEDRLLTTLREINDYESVFEQAGYDLNCVELEFAAAQRLVVQLDKFEEVPEAALRALAGRQTSETIRSILNGIIKAEQTAANVELTHLVYSGLTLHIGPLPTVCMHWRDTVEPAAPQPVAHVVAAPNPAPAPAAPAREPSGSMFDLRPIPGAAMREEKPAAPAAPPAVAQVTPPPPAQAWSTDALARFKTMPHVSKYSRS